MSQTYIIRVSAAVRERVKAKGKHTQQLVLSEVVPAAEQREILREVLQARGWEDLNEEEDKLRKQEGAVIQTLDLQTLSVETELELEERLTREREIRVGVRQDFDDVVARREREQAELERDLEISAEEKERAQARLERELADKLDEGADERRRALNEVVRDVYAESLKRKATRLGTVSEVRESGQGEDYELVIKVTE